jgi:hypothetical protein
MASSDQNNITLRSLSIYGSDGGFVPNFYVLTSGSNGTNNWTNNLVVNTLTASSIDTQTLQLNQKITYSTFTVAEVTFSSMNGNSMIGSTLNISTITYSTLTGCTITASGNTYLNVVTFSTMIGSSIIGSSIRGNITTDSNILANNISSNNFSTNNAYINTLVNNSITTNLLTFSNFTGPINVPNYCTFNQSVYGTTLKKDSVSNTLDTIVKKSLISASIDSYTNIKQIYTFGQSQSNRYVMVGPGPANTIAYSNDGLNWIGLGNILFDVNLGEGGSGVAWNGLRWVAVGEGTNHNVAYSDNGINWTGLGMIFQYKGNKVVWANNMFVAIGTGNVQIKYSYDGIIWYSGNNTSNLFTDKYGGYDIAWNGSSWIAVGSGWFGGARNSIAYSPDGINWTGLGINNLCQQGKAVAWNGSMWIVVGDYYDNTSVSNTILYSYKINPTSVTDWTGLNIIFSSYLHGIAWNGLMWIAVGDGTNGPNGANSMAYSYDGINWTGLGTSIFSTRCTTIKWTGSMWLASGDGSNTIRYSYNGINWISAPTNSIFSGIGANTIEMNFRKQHTITFPTSLTVALCNNDNNNTIVYSYDGLNWNGSGNSLFNTSGNSANFNGILWVATGQGSNHTLGYSYDGINWTGLGKSIFDSSGYNAIFNGLMWIAVGNGSNNTLAYSYDGINWIGLGKTIFLTQANSIAWNGTMWIAVGSSNGNITIAYSYDGINWTTVSSPPNATSGNNIAWNGNLWIIVASGGNTIMCSYNGINWIGLSNSIFNNVNANCGGYGIAWNGELWIAVGLGIYSSGAIRQYLAYSYDGIYWRVSNPTSGNIGTLYSVTWNGQYWICGGKSTDGGSCTYNSQDGITWTLNNNIYNIIAGSQINYISWNQNQPNISIQQAIVATGSALNTLSYSNDGILWYGLGNNIFAPSAYGVAWNGYYWVAVGTGTNSIAYSKDGLHWTPVQNSTSIFTSAYAISWNGSRWIALGTGNYSIAYSINTVEWVGISNYNTIFTSGYAIAWNGTRWIAVGTGTNSIAYSDDNGNTWTGLGNTIFTTGYSICWKGFGLLSSRWIAVGTGSNTIAYSDDNGNTWTGLGTTYFSIPNPNPLLPNIAKTGYGISFNGSRLVAVGEGTNTIIYSDDGGTTWNSANSSPFSITPPYYTIGRSVAWISNRWVVGGEFISGQRTTTAAFSSDGIVWSTIDYNNIFTVACYGIAGNPGIGVPINDSQFILTKYGIGQNNSLDLYSDIYYNTGYNNFTTTIKFSSLT